MYAKSPFHANRNRPSAGGRQLTVSWGSAATATDYTLDREHNSAGWLTLEEGTAQSFMRTASAVQGDIYRYQARGCNAAGCGPWSATATVTVLASGGGGCLGGGVCPPPRAPMVDSPPVAPAGDTGALVVATAYNAQGYPEKLTRTSDDYAYLTITAMDAYGHATTVVEGNGVTVTRGYDQATGLALSTLASGTHGTIAHLTTTWDGFGNLHERDDARNDSTETATYDDLNRLKTTNLVYHNFAGGGTLTRSFIYDATGNRTQACNDSDCTTYGYGENGYGPHAVTSMDGGGDYAYNADGEMTADGNKSLTWAAFGKATQITTSTATVTLAYGPGESRYQKTVTGATTETVTYLGSAERLTVNGQTSIRRTLSLGGIGVIDTGGATVQLLYPVSDHLGSVMAMSNGSGELAQEMSYAPFGQRRTAGWASAMGITQALTINTTETDKGYTGQESLDSVSLVDYNARLYDPALGRFLSVDPMIGHPGSTQSINPYSYVENNPLNKIDPTGEETTCSQNGSSGSTCGGGNAEASMCSNSAYCESATSVKLSNGQGISEGAPGQQIDSQKQQQSQSNSGTTGTKSSNADNDTENGTHGDIGTNDRGNEGDSSNGNDPTGSTMPAVPSVPTFDSSLSNVGLTFDSGYVPLSYKPLGGNETVGEIAGIVNGETSVMRDSSAENESLFNARVKITHVRLNGIAKWGDKVGVLAGMAHPLMHGPEYWPSVSAVQKAVQEERNFIDPTFGAYFYNERTLKQAAGMADFQNASIHTFSGPYLSTTPNKYIFTYGDP